MLNQVTAEVRQATGAGAGSRTGVADPQTQAPEAMTKSVNDWIKSVQKGVSERLHNATQHVTKTADSLRAVQATKAAGSNPVFEAINPAGPGIDAGTGEGAAPGIDGGIGGDSAAGEFDLD